MVNPINIKGKSISAGRTDVVVTDPTLANALMKNPTSVLTEFQRVLGASVSLDDIELDHNGSLIISNPELAKAVKLRLTDVSAAGDANGICGFRCASFTRPGIEERGGG